MSNSQGAGAGPRGSDRRPGANTTRVARRDEFENAYNLITPAWEIGRPQRPFMNLMISGKIKGRVLDVGCGTGEHALMAAAVGLDVVGIDTSPTAIDIATGKAHDRAVRARFAVFDALRLADLGESFDTVLDCGMFHNLADTERTMFLDGIRAVLRPGGRYFMLCFNDERRRVGAARTISQAEIRSSFADGFRVDAIESARIEESNSDGVPAWLAKITRIDTTNGGGGIEYPGR